MSKEAAATWLCFCSALITPLITRYVRRPPNLVLALLLWSARAASRHLFDFHIPQQVEIDACLRITWNGVIIVSGFYMPTHASDFIDSSCSIWLSGLHLSLYLSLLHIWRRVAWSGFQRACFGKFSTIQQMPGMENGKDYLFNYYTADYKCYHNRSFSNI